MFFHQIVWHITELVFQGTNPESIYNVLLQEIWFDKLNGVHIKTKQVGLLIFVNNLDKKFISSQQAMILFQISD